MIKLAKTFGLSWCIGCCTLLLLTAEAGSAATIRGQLNRHEGTHISPAAGVCVTVYKPGGTRSPRVCSDSNGMYYLQDVVAGNYQLEVWSSQNPARYPIAVSEPNTDIPPITVP